MNDEHGTFEVDRRTALRSIGGLGAAATLGAVPSSVAASERESSDAVATDPIWENTYGTDRDDAIYRVAEGSDGTYLGVGRTARSGPGTDRGWLVNVDEGGDVEWQETYAFDGDCYALDAAPTEGGGYLVVGYLLYEDPGRSADSVLLSVDAGGTERWRETIDPDGQLYVSKAIQSGDGGHLVVGRYGDASLRSANGWVRKLDGDGEEAWTETYGDSERLVLYIDVVATGEGYVLAGTTASVGGDQEALLTAIDESGGVRWEETYAEASADGFSGLLSTDGGFLAAGETAPSTEADADGYVVRTDASGAERWSTTVSSGGDDLLTKPVPAGDGYLIVGRAGSTTDGNADGWVVSVDADGTIGTRETFGGDGGEDFLSYAVTAADGYLLAGRTDSTAGGDLDGWILKYPGDPDGGEGYDEDGDGDIDDGELRTAIVDWSAGDISDATLREVIVRWSS